MIRIPAGTWSVGSTREERRKLAQHYGFHSSLLAGELDARRASLPEFFIDEYPVTNAEYAAFLKDTGHMEPYDWTIRGTADKADHPVVGVGGDSAAAYAEWAGKRLPTPEEWEAAFDGLPVQPDRARPAADWTPITYARMSDPGPVSAHGVHGFGQVTEWTCVTTMNGIFPFRLLKGAWWLCEEAWSFRVAFGAFAFAPWCRQWTGLRCVADRDVPSVPTADLPPPVNYVPPAPFTGNRVRLISHGHAGMHTRIPGLGDELIHAQEGWDAVDADGLRIEPVKLVSPPPAGPLDDASFLMRAQDVELRVQYRTGRDFFDMDYEFRNSHATSCSFRPSVCMNAGLIYPFYDFEGVRTWIWLGRGEWRRVREFPREGKCVRWITYVSLPEPQEYPAAALVAVVAKDGKSVFGYGRAGLTQPVSLANNMCFCCLHLDPNVVVPAGGSAAARARIYCMRGGLDDLRRRFAEDFGLPPG